MYKLRLSRREKKKLIRAKWLILLALLCAAGFVVWLAWVRPIQHEAQLNSFEACARAGNPIQTTYPEVCLTKDGKRFANPKQNQAHQVSLAGNDELVPPSNPALLLLDIEEWGVRVPLTNQTFDLSYSYFKDNGIEYLFFTYKRLIRLGVCKGTIGLTLTRSLAKHDPPYSAQNSAPVAQLDKFYFYATYADKPCYDANNPDQAALVTQIAGDKSLTQATTDLLSKLTATPAQ